MVEVLVAALLIFLSLGGIFSMNARSIYILRSTRQVTASSLMAQQRLESLRSLPWPEFTNATALSKLLRAPTDSEAELADTNPKEIITLTVPIGPDSTVKPEFSSIQVMRQGSSIRVLQWGDLGSEPVLMVTATIQWRDLQGLQERTRRTLIYRSGLTRSGIFGSALGRPAPASGEGPSDAAGAPASTLFAPR